MKIKNLEEFYLILQSSQKLKKSIVTELLFDDSAQLLSKKQSWIDELNLLLESLESIPQRNNLHFLALDDHNTIELDLSYEISEIYKDIFFLKNTEEKFYQYLNTINKNFYEDLKNNEHLLDNENSINFLTDRDGTVNNYCGRYRSSIQSIYNAVFLTRFAKTRCQNAVVLTSAPLSKIGLIEMSVFPDNTFIYAGSKGREYLDKNGKNGNFPIEQHKQEKLDELNSLLEELLIKAEYQKFTYIGSGFQKKFGQTTIAYQDITNSIPSDESQQFVNTIKKIVKDIDHKNEFFRFDETGLDLEIILTLDNQKEFDKGDGISFLNKALNLNMESTLNLICGDTKSDIPMVTAAQECNKDSLSLFVSEKQDLQETAQKANQNSSFVNSPDALVCLLNNLGKE